MPVLVFVVDITLWFQWTHFWTWKYLGVHAKNSAYSFAIVEANRILFGTETYMNVNEWINEYKCVKFCTKILDRLPEVGKTSRGIYGVTHFMVKYVGSHMLTDDVNVSSAESEGSYKTSKLIRLTRAKRCAPADYTCWLLVMRFDLLRSLKVIELCTYRKPIFPISG